MQLLTVFSIVNSMVGSPRVVVVNMLNCNIVVSEFEPQLSYYVHFYTNNLREGMSVFITTSAIG